MVYIFEDSQIKIGGRFNPSKRKLTWFCDTEIYLKIVNQRIKVQSY